MNLDSWMHLRGVDPNRDFAFITVATDGFKIGRDHVMAVSVATNTKGPCNTVYIRGACPSQVEEYTGLAPSYYNERAVGIDRAIDTLGKLLGDRKVLVSYTVQRFTRPWFIHLFDALDLGKVWLDAVNLLKIKDVNETIPHELETIEDLASRLQIVAEIKKQGYAIDALLKQFSLDGWLLSLMEEGVCANKLESRCWALLALFNDFSAMDM